MAALRPNSEDMIYRRGKHSNTCTLILSGKVLFMFIESFSNRIQNYILLIMLLLWLYIQELTCMYICTTSDWHLRWKGRVSVRIGCLEHAGRGRSATGRRSLPARLQRLRGQRSRENAAPHQRRLSAGARRDGFTTTTRTAIRTAIWAAAKRTDTDNRRNGE